MRSWESEWLLPALQAIM
ncbi:hypothetical protein A2U01_0109096, partial [Trifolium medium]|nr:hypothetical protein [Trifolium medium]